MYLTILSGILLALAYPVFNLEFLAFFAFVPLFFAIKNVSARKAFLLAYLTGIIFWTVTIYWLIHVTLIGLILLVLYLSLYFGIFGIFFKLVTDDKKGRPQGAAPTFNFVLIPIAWVFLEYLRSTLITGFPWALLGYSQYLNLPFIQIADIFGVWGVSFLVMMVNVGVYNIIICRGRFQTCPNITKGGSWTRPYYNGIKFLIVPFALLSLSFANGFYKIHKIQNEKHDEPIKISLIQGNIPQHQKWDMNFRESILERYETLTRKAARDKPDLIIWPETSAPGAIGDDPDLLDRIIKLAREIRTPLLIGTVAADNVRCYNSAILFSTDGRILQQYDKLHLVPFGEYVPLERYLPFLRDWIGIPIGDFTPGRKYTIFGSPVAGRRSPVKFAVLICFEDIIQGLSHKFIKNDAQFLVNITNDAWFMETSAPYQHAAASVFRAVENRVPVVRAANTGLSCFIDRTGRIYDKVSDGKKDIFVVGYKTTEIKVMRDQ
ncbi:MAG: apolipoprotein N-acyltransferase [Candidatus Omnitrophica bacterium]|nr:apolipoprotein N-acyltransferase [Candidatus Omnitrophota bacterium]